MNKTAEQSYEKFIGSTGDYSADNIIKAIEYAIAASQSPAGWVRALAQIRDKLYEALPTGDVKAWDLIQMIKWHINDLDTLCSKMAETPSHTEAGIESLKKEIKDYCAGVEYVPAQDIINIVDGGLNPFPVLNL